jgi:hypothetical protein
MNEKLKILQAYEIYSLVGGGYNRRHLHGYAWTKDEAQFIADALRPRRYHIGAVHLIELHGRWHRINVIPVEEVAGSLEAAQDSRLVAQDIPPRHIPGINYQIEESAPRRLGLDFEKAINTLAECDPDSKCKLYTFRTGGKLPMSFRVRDLLLSEHTQMQVAEWLNHEIQFRLNQGAGNDNPRSD